MTSKIVVNNIEADAGVSTVTFGSKISSTEFVGPVTGNVTGNLSGNVTGGSLSGISTIGVTTAYITNLAGVGAGTSIQVSSGSKLVGLSTGSIYAPGAIIQVIQKDITSTASTNSDGSHSIISTLDSPITTLLTGSKILIMSSIAGNNNAGGNDMSWKIFRSISGTNTEIDLNPSPVGSTTTGIWPNMRTSSSAPGFTLEGLRWDYKYLDTHGQSAGTTITYKFAVRTESGNSWEMNQGNQTADGRFTTTVSHVILMEVA